MNSIKEETGKVTVDDDEPGFGVWKIQKNETFRWLLNNYFLVKSNTVVASLPEFKHVFSEMNPKSLPKEGTIEIG